MALRPTRPDSRQPPRVETPPQEKLPGNVANVQEAGRRYIADDRRDVARLTGAREVANVSVPGPLRQGVSKGELLATQVLLRALSLTLFPNNRTDEGSGGSDPESGA